MDRIIKIDFSLVEATALRQMIDFAIQAKGLGIAEAAVVLDKKIVAAMQAENKVELE